MIDRLKNKGRNWHFPGRTDENHEKCGSVGLSGFNLRASKHDAEVPTARCDPHNKQLRYPLEHSPGDLCNREAVFSVSQEQKRLAQSQTGSCKTHLMASPCRPISILLFPRDTREPRDEFLLHRISESFTKISYVR